MLFSLLPLNPHVNSFWFSLEELLPHNLNCACYVSIYFAGIWSCTLSQPGRTLSILLTEKRKKCEKKERKKKGKKNKKCGEKERKRKGKCEKKKERKEKKCEKRTKDVRKKERKGRECEVKKKRKTFIHSPFECVVYQRWLCSCFRLFQEKSRNINSVGLFTQQV